MGLARPASEKFCNDCGAELTADKPPQMGSPLPEFKVPDPVPCIKCSNLCPFFDKFCTRCGVRQPERFTAHNADEAPKLDFVLVERRDLAPGEGLWEALERNTQTHAHCEPGKCQGHATGVGQIQYGAAAA